MKCSVCKDSTLSTGMDKRGVEVETCGQCKRMWLDEGEILHFSSDREAFSKVMLKAMSLAETGSFISPMTKKPMRQLKLFDGKINLYFCPTSNGMWLEADTVERLVAVAPSDLMKHLQWIEKRKTSNMKCPNCISVLLTPRMTKQKVEVEFCSKCGGIWLDEGEISKFNKVQVDVAKGIEEAMKISRPSKRLSAKTKKPMREVKLFDGALTIDVCPMTKGIWFDAGEAEQLLKGASKYFSITKI